MTTKDLDAAVNTTKNADGSTTLSMRISDMSQDQLEQLLNAHQNKRDELREKCIYLRKALDKKLEEKRHADIDAQIARLQAQRAGNGDIPIEEGVQDGNAPGAVIAVQASKPVQNEG